MALQLPRHSTSRRSFLKKVAAAGAVTIVGSGTGLRPMTAWALPGQNNDTVLVSVFLRGGADGLNIVVPHGDDEYYARRPTLGLTAGSYTDLDGFFGLSNDFAQLLPEFQQGRLAIVHAAGSPDPTLSHFAAQPKMDTGFGSDGWLQRALGIGQFSQSNSGLTIGDRVSPPLQGPYSGAVVNTINQTIRNGMSLAVARTAIEEMYETTRFPLERTAVTSALATIDQVSSVTPGDPAAYPSHYLSTDFREAAALIKADVGVRGVAIDFGGWDTHENQTPRLATLGPQLSQAMAAFQADLGAAAPRVVTVVMTEFGRTVRENGSAGTDHGHGNFMMVMGESLVGNGGGNVLLTGPWPGLAESQLNEGRDLVLTTDFRSVLGELLDRHLGVNPAAVFAGFTPQYVGLLDALLRGDTNGSGSLENADVQSILDAVSGDPGAGYSPLPGDLDRDGDTDLRDALLLAQQLN